MDERSERRHQEAHDILAADEFGIGTRDDRYPGDPSGIERPHDVLAAEEFAMPAGGGAKRSSSGGPGPRALLPLALVVLAVLLVLRRAARGRGRRPRRPRRSP